MPKVTLSESQKEREIIKQNLVLLQGGMSCSDMGKIIGVSKSTYINRLKRPTQLTLEEVQRLCKHFRISVATFVSDTLNYK